MIQIRAAVTEQVGGKLARRYARLEAASVVEAFKMLDAGGWELAFFEYENTEDFLDASLATAAEAQRRGASAQLAGMREVEVWVEGEKHALPNWAWRVGYAKVPVPIQKVQLTADAQRRLRVQ